MAFALLTHTAKEGSVSAVTTNAIDTTGAGVTPVLLEPILP